MSMIDTPLSETLARFLDLTSFRHQLIVSNLANIDTPGYHTRDIDFRRELETATGEMQDAGFSPVARPVEGLVARPDGNNVSLERESLLLSETQLRYQTAVQVLRVEFHRLSMAINEGRQS
jgi:flagellar basal-body rod protein FlgB